MHARIQRICLLNANFTFESFNNKKKYFATKICIFIKMVSALTQTAPPSSLRHTKSKWSETKPNPNDDKAYSVSEKFTRKIFPSRFTEIWKSVVPSQRISLFFFVHVVVVDPATLYTTYYIKTCLVCRNRWKWNEMKINPQKNTFYVLET